MDDVAVPAEIPYWERVAMVCVQRLDVRPGFSMGGGYEVLP